jgi:TetR/AcrR family transcriptional regulator, mexJK operon transcriptional repressor
MTRAASDDADTSPCTSKRLAARREAFLAAARDVFQEKGYADATLDDVIARSGGSRQTLYSLFGGKQGLFEAIVSERCSTIFEALAPQQIAARPPEEVLEEVGIRYLGTVTSPKGLSLFRLVVAEAHRIPEVAQQFWKFGPGRTRALLAEYFDRQVERGALRMPDTSAAAGYFIDMLPGTVRLQCLLGLREPPTPGEIKQIVRDAVAQFLHGCRVHQTDQSAPTAQVPPKNVRIESRRRSTG